MLSYQQKYAHGDSIFNIGVQILLVTFVVAYAKLKKDEILQKTWGPIDCTAWNIKKITPFLDGLCTLPDALQHFKAEGRIL